MQRLSRVKEKNHLVCFTFISTKSFPPTTNKAQKTECTIGVMIMRLLLALLLLEQRLFGLFARHPLRIAYIPSEMQRHFPPRYIRFSPQERRLSPWSSVSYLGFLILSMEINYIYTDIENRDSRFIFSLSVVLLPRLPFNPHQCRGLPHVSASNKDYLERRNNSRIDIFCDDVSL